MSAEVVKHAITVNRATLIKGLKKLAADGSSVALMLFLVTAGGKTTALAWEIEEAPGDVPEVLRQAVDECDAVAGLFLGEFESTEGERVVCVHYTCPAMNYSGSDWFAISDLELCRVTADNILIDEEQLHWLDQALYNR